MAFRGLANRRGLLGRVLENVRSFSTATARDVTTDLNTSTRSLIKSQGQYEGFCTQGMRAFSSRASMHTGLLSSRTSASVPEVACLPFSLVDACTRTRTQTTLLPIMHTRGMAKAARAQKDSALKIWRPLTPGQRGRVTTKRNELWKGKPHKALTVGLKKSGGRNNQGRTTVWWRGGGAKRLYRIIDFKRQLTGVEGVVRRIEYDPNRSARIALVDYEGDAKATHYIIAPDGIKAGDPVTQGPEAPIKPGNALPLINIPVGSVIHNVELLPGKGGQLARAAGSSCTLVKKAEDGYASIKLQSGEVRLVLSRCYATIGVVSNKEHANRKLGKAGASRHLGRRPHVRGVAMNPVDHPMGGGEGRTSGGRPSCTPWGVPCKGFRTRNNPRTDVFRVARRPPKKKSNK
uniref:Large ribosomal subunit protein uL2m n=1 Tax=Pyramimonas obovata TaxID=1411642 RepID=A0A7S0RN69_9CHLO|mmetsp:Transcript_38751/g.84305  ORF Transcript_38751/g.84305 Transcript_38751/m.84305 type:complete len:404 (+) Transcript_38751:124-1335(+)|eukprot:CAMPEP_0118933580 /NCGR_PEP_ID=MMETSP1169-20130426/12069_1 /TAXON_ID=36882 /ORGANISM="Pyramimonas obovata, Strain CCMP722" /LENGTH=403 /DNA_ID=CAMNT_0006876363 /DNA_START=112 /DNA_END=1323 /DNA_ORIENTATION=+